MIHRYILGTIKPDLTFLLKVDINKALQRINRRKKKNRYDKFSRSFYVKAQNAFIKIAKSNTKRYLIINNSKDTKGVEEIIFKKTIKKLKK